MSRDMSEIERWPIGNQIKEFNQELIWDANEASDTSRPSSPPCSMDIKPPIYRDRDLSGFLPSAKLYLDYVLSLNKVKIDGHLTEFLTYEGVAPLFVTYITRIPGEIEEILRGVQNCGTVDSNISSEIFTKEEVIELSFLPRDHSDEAILKRSYNAMFILCAETPLIKRYIEEKFDILVRGLFNIFHPKSQGNFYHFQKVMASFMIRSPRRLSNFVLNRRSGSFSSVSCSQSLNKNFFSNSLTASPFPSQPLNAAPILRPHVEPINTKTIGFSSAGTSPLSASIPSHKCYLIKMIPFLHHHPVSGAFHTFIFMPTKTSADIVARRNSFSWLGRIGILQQLFDTLQDLDRILTQKDADRVDDSAKEHVLLIARAISDSFVRLVEEACRTEDSYLLFSSLIQDSSIVEQLVKNLSIAHQSRHFVRRRVFLDIINTLLLKCVSKDYRLSLFVSSMSTCGNCIDESSFSELKLKDFKKTMELYFLDHLASLQALFSSDVEEKKGKKIKKMSHFRLIIMEVLVELSKHCLHQPSLIHQFDDCFWKCAIDCFFDLPDCNLYHDLFYKFLLLVLKLEDSDIYHKLFVDHNLVDRLVQNFRANVEQKLGGNTGHIVLILNTIRLNSKWGEKSKSTCKYLKQSGLWKGFKKELQKATMSQTIATTAFEIPKKNRPLPHFGPCSTIFFEFGQPKPKFVSSNQGDFINSLSMFSPQQMIGIDIGSRYAISLGFFKVDPLSSPKQFPLEKSASVPDSMTNLSKEEVESSSAEEIALVAGLKKTMNRMTVGTDTDDMNYLSSMQRRRGSKTLGTPQFSSFKGDGSGMNAEPRPQDFDGAPAFGGYSNLKYNSFLGGRGGPV